MHGTTGPGDNDLLGRVEINRRQDLALRSAFAKRPCGVFAEAHDRRHSPFALGNRLLHETSTISHQAHGFAEVQRTRAHQGTVLAQAVSGHLDGTHALLCKPDTPDGDTRSKHRRLRVLRLIQTLSRPFLHQRPQIEAECVRGLSERVPDLVMLGG